MHFYWLPLKITFKVKVFGVFSCFLIRSKMRNTVIENYHFYTFKYVWLYIIFLEVVVFSEKFKNPKKPIFFEFFGFWTNYFSSFFKKFKFCEILSLIFRL